MRGLLVALLLVGGARVAAAHPAWGIVVDARGVVYFADVAKNCIWRAEASGRASRLISGKHSHPLYLDSVGTLYGEHVSYEAARKLWWTSVWKATPDGVVTELVPPHSDGGGPSALELASGRKEVGDIVRRTRELTSVGALALASDHALLVTVGDTVQKLAVDGTAHTLARGVGVRSPRDDWFGGGGFNRLFGVTEHRDGAVYVADYGMRRIARIGRNGQVETVFRSPWPWAPTGVAVAGDELYVLELRKPTGGVTRVRRVAKDGSSRVIAEPD